MGLESGTFTDDLVITNPPGSDSKSQGDDHLRLIKTVLRNTLKRATKSFYLPGVITKNANYIVQASDENYTFAVDCSGTNVTLTMPALGAGDAGWAIYVLRSDTGSAANTILISGPGVNGYSYVRRSIPYVPTKVIWTGSTWVATRPNNGAPIGSVINFYGSNLPY